ncbi:Nicotianamine synthase protein [Tepidimicrobium xylanilyticum]|uniref:Nicotianamine synthase protein n=2 Tax=Tepidimicrobium xylanilyticum TaxID=1123352 RepID=A0A1H2QH86_9FIRM|nr:Nicotianamine synthase protein [Tepidimicrobium xylanilyticum]
MEKRISFSETLVNLYNKYYERLVKNEVEIAGIKDGDKVLCIGGGSIPCTALQMAKLTDAKIHVLDIDEEAVERARYIVEKLGLEDKIKVIWGNGEVIEPSDYDVIHIALQVQSKDEVFENILSKSKRGTRIIIRNPKKSRRVFYSNISNKLLVLCKDCMKNCSLNCYNPNMDEIMLVVKN